MPITNQLTGITYTDEQIAEAHTIKREGDVHTKGGCLYAHGSMIPLPMADLVAMVYGEQCAERLVTRLQLTQDLRIQQAAPVMLEALEGLLSIGKRDLTNDKYDSYFAAAKAAIALARKGEQ